MATHRHLNPKTGAHGYDVEPGASRPPIVFITVDMIPPESYAPDHPIREHLRTPNMDRLLGDGVRFTNAFSASPLCGPSRACTLTGRYPYLMVNEERAHDGSEVALRASDAIFPEYLKAVGYQCKHVGKSHVGTGKFLAAFGENDAPWNRWAAPMGDDDGYLAYLREMGLEPPVWRDPVQGLRPDGRTPGNTYGGWITRPDGSEFPEEGSYSQYTAWLAGEKLEWALAQTWESQAPAYLQADFFAPHQPFMVPGAYRERARELGDKVQLPNSYFAAMQDEHAPWPRVYDFYRRNWGLYDPEMARQYMLMNFLEIEALDAAIGRLLAKLNSCSLYEDALVIFTADHGEMNCERGLIDKGVYGHPKVAGVPLGVKLPGVRGAGTCYAGLVSLLDPAPTILEAAGVLPNERLDGESLLPFCRREKATRERPFVFECGWHVCPNPAVATFAQLDDGRRLMYTYNLTSDRDELYDLDDLHCCDRAADAEWAGAREEMIRRLGAILEADPRWACYWHTFRLDHYERLTIGGGDFQMFRPD